MKAVIYARYSSDSQREESIEGQIRECTEYGFCFRTEEHSRQTPLHLPDVQSGVPGNDDGNAMLGLEKHLALVAVTGKVLGTVLFDNRLSAEKEFESHFSAPFVV